MRSQLSIALALPLVLPSCDAGLGTAELAASPGAPAGSGGAGAEGSTSSDASRPGSGLVILPGANDPLGPTDPDLARPYFHSFGRVADGETVSHVFRLRNTDEVPVSILDVKPGCGCTVPALRTTRADQSVVRGVRDPRGDEPRITVDPGAVVEVELAIDTQHVSNKNADKTVQTTLTTDSPNGYYVKLETHVFVERPFQLVPNGVNLGRVPVSGGGEGKVEIVRAGGFDHTIEQVAHAPEGLQVELASENRLGTDVWTLSVRLLPPLDLGRWTGTAELTTRGTDGSPGRPVAVPVQADVVPDLSPSPSRFVFLAQDDESFGQVTLTTLMSGHRFGVTAADVSAEHRTWLSIGFEAEDADTRGRSPRWLLTLRALEPEEITELVRGVVRVQLDDPQHPFVDIPYVVHPAKR